MLRTLGNVQTALGSRSVLVLPLLLVVWSIGARRVETLQLNLTASCSDNQVYLCSLSNLTATYDEPLDVVNASVPLLTELVLRYSHLRRLPSAVFARAPSLKTFLLHNCDLHRIQATDFVRAQQLRVLLIQSTSIYELPERVFASSFALEELLLGRNQLHMVHRYAFYGLERLRYLNMEQNAIEELPDGVFAELINLQHIDLSGNTIEKIDANTFATNVKLQTILLGDNRFVLFEPNALEHLPHLHLLDISNAALDEIALQSVDTLLVQGSGLKRLTISGRALKVNAANNRLTGLSVGDKLAMRELDLHGNLLESLDDVIGMLNLQRLVVSKNRLRSLGCSRAPFYLPLPSLTHLNLAFNQLKNLSDDQLLMLQKLTHLDVAFNMLAALRAEVLEPLGALENLYIEGNSLQQLDYRQICQSHPHLAELGLFENDWALPFLREMINHVRERGITLPVRFTSSTRESAHSAIGGGGGGSSTTQRSKSANHHHYASTTTSDMGRSTTAASMAQVVTGIHPYWTLHDALALGTLLVCMFILLLQLCSIFREEQCFASCWRRVHDNTDGARTPRRQRLNNTDEDDSEV